MGLTFRPIFYLGLKIIGLTIWSILYGLSDGTNSSVGSHVYGLNHGTNFWERENFHCTWGKISYSEKGGGSKILFFG